MLPRTRNRARPSARRPHGHRRFIIWLLAGAVVTVQIFYPGDQITPFTRLDGQSVSSKTSAEVAAIVANDVYKNASIRVAIEGPAKQAEHTSTLLEAGLQPSAAATLSDLRAYPFWQRLIPMSLLLRGLVTDRAVRLAPPTSTASAYIKTLEDVCAVKPTDASVKVNNGAAELAPSKDGQKCETATTKERLQHVALRRTGIDLELSAEKVAPLRGDKQVKPMVKTAQKLINQDIGLIVAGQTHELNRSTIGSMLSFTADAKDPTKLTIDLDSEAVRTYLKGIEEKIYKAPTETTKGRVLNYSATRSALRKQIFETGDGIAKGVVVDVAAGTTVSDLYPANPAGLQQLLDDIVASKSQYGISVRMLDGTVTSSRGDVYYHPASTYKMYVAYALLKRIESGKYRWSDKAAGDLTISQCFDKMIVNSDNACAEWFGNSIGWVNINNDVHAIGLSSGTRTLYGQQRSTANDETLFLAKLQNGSLLHQAERDRLLGVMKRQVYRRGIPAGLRGLTVADKVGFLDADLHDAAIVYAPKQTYALVILTTGSSWAGIADAAAQIQLQLDRM